MTRIRTDADVTALTDLSTAEKQLLQDCGDAKPTVLGTSAPDTKTKANSVRADLLRYLILGGCKGYRPDELGVRLSGAYVTGTLDLSFATAHGATLLRSCRFENRIAAVATRFNLLDLSGAHMPGLNAQGAQVMGDVFLSDGFSSIGEVSLSGAKIGGQLACDGGRFDNAGGHALNAEGARVMGDVFLSDGFSSIGEVSLSGAEIGGQLACKGGRFDNAGGDALNAQGARVTGSVFLRDGFTATGEVSLSGAEIGGQLSCTGGRFDNAGGCALNAQRMRVTAGFLWRGVSVAQGVVHLTSARVGDLVDDVADWPARDADGAERLVLDGFVYDRIGAAATDAGQRLEWLSKGSSWRGVFHPQPYEQLAKVLGDMGHAEDRREVLIARERLQRKADRAGQRFRRRFASAMAQLSLRGTPEQAARVKRVIETMPPALVGEVVPRWTDKFRLLHRPSTPPPIAPPALSETTMFYARRQFRNDLRGIVLAARGRLLWNNVADQFLRRMLGYGYAPARSIGWAAGLIGIGWLVAHLAWITGDFAPNSDVIVNSDAWQVLARDASVENPAEVWSSAPGPGVPQGQGMDYEAFHSLAYAVDVVVPLVVLGQEATWAPSKDRGPWGWHLWWLRWVLTGAGWVVAAFGAAAVTGLIRRD